MAQTFRVVERVYPEHPDWERRMSAYKVMVNVAIRIIKEGRKEEAEPPDDDSGLPEIWTDVNKVDRKKRIKDKYFFGT